MLQNESKYIVAVSGGVDSVVLLHKLVHQDPSISNQIPSGSTFVVAHVNHGIRGDSANSDSDFVRNIAATYDLPFEVCNLHLGPEASEEEARDGRYKFLESLVSKYSARGIILAHHADDVVETAVINVMRGTGRRGLSSLSSTAMRNRPLLHMSKEQIIDYAHANNLSWVEDETNADHKYLRNRVRSSLKTAPPKEKGDFASELQKIREINTVLNVEIAKVLQYRLKGKLLLARSWFVKLPHDLACEIMHAVLVKLGIADIDRQLVEKLVVALKVGKPGVKIDIDRDRIGLLTKRSLRFVDRTTHKTLVA
jgi:tRNA(Ile)-lysidine synthase